MARHKMSKTSGKRKKATGAKRSTRRRRRVGASGAIESLAMNGLAVGAGVVAVREISILAGSMFPSLSANPTITGVLEMGLGGITAYMSKGGFVRFAGLGAFGEGLMTTLNGLGIVGGPPQTMAYNFVNRKQMGDPRLQFVAGPATRIGYPNPMPLVAGTSSFPNNFNVVAGARRKRRYAT